MPEIIEFEITHEYNIFKAGISVETTLKYNGKQFFLSLKLIQVQLFVFLNAIKAKQ